MRKLQRQRPPVSRAGAPSGAGRRRLFFETLEARRLLAADWHNAVMPEDVTGDGQVTSVDVLVGVNELNRPLLTSPDGQLRSRATDSGLPLLDTNGDSLFTHADVLRVVNLLNQRSSGAQAAGNPDEHDCAVRRFAFATLDDEGTTEIAVDSRALKLGTTLSHLSSDWSQCGDSLFAEDEDAESLTNATGGWKGYLAQQLIIEDERVLLNVTADGDAAEWQSGLEEVGMEVTATFGPMLGGWMPIVDLPRLMDVDGIRFARPAVPGRAAIGSVDSQGDFAMLANSARNVFGVDGTGIKVGVISDSYDKDGTEAAGDVASGDLPGTGNPNGYTTAVTVLDDATSGIDEGRAMLQIVHDVAPGAELLFHTASGSKADYASAIIELKDAGADVIVDDILDITEAMFQDDVIAQAVDTVDGAGVTYLSAAGNDATNSYEAPFRDSGTDYLTTPFAMHDFDPGPGVDVFQEINATQPFMGSDPLFQLSLQWNEPFDAATSDLAMCFHSAPTNVAGSQVVCANDGNIGATPQEFFGFFHSSFALGSTTYVTIIHVSGTEPTLMKYWANDALEIAEHETNSSTNFGHSNAAGAIAVGSVGYEDSPYFATAAAELRDYSALSGTQILFDTSGTALPSPEIRQKPNLTASDGANTTFFGQEYFLDPDTHPNFFGTSAAAPHLAAVAALMLDAAGGSGSMTPDEVTTVLENTATEVVRISGGADLDTGFNHFSGHGHVDALAAVTAAKNFGNGSNFDFVFDADFAPDVDRDDGVADSYQISLDGSDVVIEVSSTEVARTPLASLNSLQLLGSSDDDTFTVDLTGGSPVPSGGIRIEGGQPSASDTVVIEGGAAAESVTLDGNVLEVGGAPITLVGIEHLDLDLNGGDDALQVLQSFTGALLTTDLDGGGESDKIEVDSRSSNDQSATIDGTTVEIDEQLSTSLGFVEHLTDGGTDSESNTIDGLDGASGIAYSPDGESVYVTGSEDDGIVHFERQSADGSLVFEGTELDGINGLENVSDVAVSPDNKFIYAAGRVRDSIVVLEHNLGTNTLSFVQTIKNGDISGGSTVDGLDGAFSIAISPDATGAHVYVAGEANDAIAVFSRNATTGELTFVERQKQGIGGVSGLKQVFSIFVSPDGNHVYSAADDDNAVAVFSRNTTTGALTFVESIQDEGQDAAANPVTKLAGAFAVTVSPDDDHVYVAARNDNAIVVFSRNTTTGVLTWQQDVIDGSGSVDGLDGANSLAISADGKHLFATGLDEDALASFTRNATSGQLAFLSVIKDGGTLGGSLVDELDAPRSVRLDPANGDHVYVASSQDNAVTVFERNTTSGALTFVEAEVDGVSTNDGLFGAFATAVSPDGNHLYTAGAFEHEVGVFDRSTSTGALTYQTRLKGGSDGLDGATDVAVSSDGDFLYAVGAVDDALVVFERAAGGELTFLQTVRDGEVLGGATVNGLDQATAVVVSPDSKHLYVASPGDQAIGVFERDATTGRVSFVEVLVDGQLDSASNTVDGLTGVVELVTSPGGQQVYAVSDPTGSGDDSLVHFDRDSSTGKLTFVSALAANGSNALDGVQGVDVSLDGKHVYAAAQVDDAITVWSRNSADGVLTLAQTLKEGDTQGSETVDGLDGAIAVSVNPQGNRVVVAGMLSDAVAVFQRDASTNTLTFLDSIMHGDMIDGGTVGGLDAPKKIAFSPDGRHLVAASADTDSIAILRLPEQLSVAYSAYESLRLRSNAGSDTVTLEASGLPAAVTIDTQGPQASDTLVLGGTTAADAWTLAENTISDGSSTVTLLGLEHLSLDLSQDGTDSASISQTFAGALTSISVTGGGTGSDGFTVTSSGSATQYATVSESSVVLAEQASSEVSFVEAQVDNAGGVDGLEGAFSVAVSPDGRDVYAAAAFENEVSAFRRDLTTGALTYVEREKNGENSVAGLASVSGVAVSPDGEHVYAAGRGSDAIVTFSRDASTGELTFVEALFNGATQGSNTIDGIDGAFSVAVSPDGQFVLVAGEVSDAIAVFRRDLTTGKLTFVDRAKDGIDGVDGLDQVFSVAVSPDGKHVYGAADDDHAVSVFSLDGSTGELSFVEKIADGDTQGPMTIDKLAGAVAVTVSADGGQVYVAARTDHAITVFSRNPATGALTFLEVLEDGVGGVDGLNGTFSVSVSPDGDLVYAAGTGENELAVFRRSSADGKLTFAEVEQDGTGGVSGLDTPRSVAPSPDGRHVYTASSQSDALAVFRRPESLTVGLSALNTLAVTTADGADRFDVTPSTSVVITVDGGAPAVSPGDVFNFIPLGVLPTDNGSTLSSTTFADVNYQNFERVNIVSLDIDDDGSFNALTDGILVQRFLFGFTGQVLINGAVDTGAQRSTASAIETYFDDVRHLVLDVDDNGAQNALTDGILILRYLFGFSGSLLTDQAVDTGAERTEAADIIAFLDQFKPT